MDKIQPKALGALITGEKDADRRPKFFCSFDFAGQIIAILRHFNPSLFFVVAFRSVSLPFAPFLSLFVPKRTRF